MNILKNNVESSIRSMGDTIKESSVNLSNFSNKSNSPINSVITNTPSIGQSFGQSIKSNIGNSFESAKSVLSTPPETSSGMFSNILNFKSITFWIILILALAFLGFNIFTYLSQGTEYLADILKPITSLIANISGETTKSTVTNTSDGTQTIIDTVSETGKTIVDSASKGTIGGISALQSGLKKSSVNAENDDKLNSSSKYDEPEPIQTNSSQDGYCYIGKINDTRYCSKITSKNKCMSGDIYPSMDICVNPNLRN